MSSENILVPLTVPKNMKEEYVKNYVLSTQGSGRLMLFAGDQKFEHLNDDFFGDGICKDDADPEHLFKIADSGNIGVFAAQLGLIARYGMDYPDIPYLVKINSKTNLVKTQQMDPFSSSLANVDDIVMLKNEHGLNIVGVGYTLYLGSEYESKMISAASKLVIEAHKAGLIVVLWIYPRGNAVADEKDPHLIAGATGVAACIGADFVKVNYPKREGEHPAESFKEATLAAGRTKVICAGGSSTDPNLFLQTLYEQIHTGGAMGNATGRNIHQKPLDEAIRMCKAITAITNKNQDVEKAIKIYYGEDN